MYVTSHGLCTMLCDQLYYRWYPDLIIQIERVRFDGNRKDMSLVGSFGRKRSWLCILPRMFIRHYQVIPREVHVFVKKTLRI